MRRIIHNTTAIVACLSLMAPHITMAQTPEQPLPPAGEGQGGQPEAQAPAPMEPAPAEAPAPAAAEPVSAEAPAELEPETPAPAEVTEPEPAETPDAAPAQADAVTPPEAPAAEAPPVAEAPAAPAPTKPEPAEPAPAEADSPAAPETTAPAEKAADAPAEAEAAKSAAPVKKPTSTEGKPKEKPETPKEMGDKAPSPADDSAANGAASGNEAAGNKAAGGEDALAEALAKENKAAEQGDPKTDPAPAEGARPEAAETEVAKPEAAEPAAEDSLAEALAKEKQPAKEAAEQPVENQDENPVAGATAEDKATADVSKPEPAQGTTSEAPAKDLSALTAESGDGEVTEEKVTEENSRSSTEDFETKLDEASSGQVGQQAKDDDDDDKSDLAKAVLLGLGGLAVGTMLSNNREVQLSTPDRLVITNPDGTQEVIRDDTALLRQPGATVTTENFNDGSSRTTVLRSDGSQVVTIRDGNLRVLRRTLISADGTSTPLIDDTAAAEPVDVASLPAPAEPVQTADGPLNEEELRAALLRDVDVGRQFTLGQIRDISEVRALVAPINIDAITFDTGSAAIDADQARQLSALGNVIQESIQENPREIFMIEGHTDAVGDAAMNLALSDRRAESVALALTEYFDVPPENLVTQGYGEQFPKVEAEGDNRDNRRASVRRITDLLQTASAE